MFGRDLSRVLKSVSNPKNYESLIKARKIYFNIYQDFFKGYILQNGNFPKSVKIKTPTSIVSINILNSLDYFTINEIFCWEIYFTNQDPNKIIVDLGSNIGCSEIYFLSRNTSNIVYGFEPVPHLYRQLQQNTSSYKERVCNSNYAVSDIDAEVTMGVESSGRYGGIGVETGEYITVKSRDINSVLSEILAKHEKINLIKIDIEGVEEKVVNAIDKKYLKRIEIIYIESGDEPISPSNLVNDFVRYNDGGISKFVNRNLQ